MISFKCKFWINECVISVLLYNFISTRHFSRSLMSSSLDFNKNSRLHHELCYDIDCTVKIALVQKMCWCKYCIHAKIVLVQEMCWCKECADAKIALWHRLHWCKDCTDAKIVLWHWLHWCKKCAGARNALMQEMCWCKECTMNYHMSTWQIENLWLFFLHIVFEKTISKQ